MARRLRSAPDSGLVLFALRLVLRRLAPPSPALKASVPGPYTLSGRLIPNERYLDRYALTEALLPITTSLPPVAYPSMLSSSASAVEA